MGGDFCSCTEASCLVIQLWRPVASKQLYWVIQKSVLQQECKEYVKKGWKVSGILEENTERKSSKDRKDEKKQINSTANQFL